MKQITLRGMDPMMEKEIRRRARESGKSLNRVVLEMLSRVSGGKGRQRGSAGNSLKRFAGGWSEKDASEFLNGIKSCAQIDEGMWK
jgi:hypothetical protein